MGIEANHDPHTKTDTTALGLMAAGSAERACIKREGTFSIRLDVKRPSTGMNLSINQQMDFFR
jgi:hypothetical protein